MANVPVAIGEALDRVLAQPGSKRVFRPGRPLEIDAGDLAMDPDDIYGFVHCELGGYFMVVGQSKGRFRNGPYRTVDIYAIDSEGKISNFLGNKLIIWASPVFLSPRLDWVNFSDRTYCCDFPGGVGAAWQDWSAAVKREEEKLPPPPAIVHMPPISPHVSLLSAEQSDTEPNKLTARKSSWGLSPAAQMARRAKKRKIGVSLKPDDGDAASHRGICSSARGPAVAPEGLQ